jgi:hypothetical protein
MSDNGSVAANIMSSLLSLLTLAQDNLKFAEEAPGCFTEKAKTAVMTESNHQIFNVFYIIPDNRESS